MSDGFAPREQVPLAPFTTLGIGGAARFFAEIASEETLAQALAWADEKGLRTLILGGGSNLLVADRGVEALVLRLRIRGIAVEPVGDRVHIDAAAGEPWDEVAALAVSMRLSGIECLSGIPGEVGATPIQNVGAYGQEVGDTIVSVRALRRSTGVMVELDRSFCDFSYRDSIFKRSEKDAFVITRVRFALHPGGAPSLRYGELVQRFEARGIAAPSLSEVRAMVIELRRGKSMVLDAADENGRSAGSFFMNPTVDAEGLLDVRARVEAAGVLGAGETMPEYAAAGGRTKLSAAWLIERAGFHRGAGEGRVGLSTKHTLAIVNRGGASASEILAFARTVREGVAARFGVELQAEPVMEGFTREEISALPGG